VSDNVEPARTDEENQDEHAQKTPKNANDENAMKIKKKKKTQEKSNVKNEKIQGSSSDPSRTNISSSDSAELIAARNEAMMEEAVKKTHEKAIALRPHNTNKAYSSKQQEFIDWCEEKKFDELSRSTVTGYKLHWFLNERVVNRKRKVRRKDDTGDEVIGNHTLKQYVNAIIDLYRRQKAAGVNSNEQPRIDAVQLLLKNHASDTANRKRANYDDRAAGSLLDGYTTQETLNSIANAFWDLNNGTGLRDRASFLLCHSLFLRGENVRFLELPDMFSIALENESPSQSCYALIALLDRGKTNTFGKVEYAGCIRHAQVESCTVGAVAFHFFYRFMINGEPFPNMSASSMWYDTKFMNSSKSNTEPISFTSHSRPINEIFKKLNLPFNKKTHVGRSSGARMADLAGASHDHIRRQGRWNSSSLDSSYLINLPREILRTTAGFSPMQGSYFLKRDILQPPESLQKQIFPEADHWLHFQQTCKEPNLAAGGFLNLICFLRKVVLQDAAEMLIMGKHHAVLNHKIFKSAEFLRYKSELHNAMNNMESEPQEQLIRRAFPLLAERLQTLESRTLGAVEALKHEVQTLTNTVNSMSSDVTLQMNSANLESILRKSFTDIFAKGFLNSATEKKESNENLASTNLENEKKIDTENEAKITLSFADTLKDQQVSEAPQQYTLCRGIKDCINFWKEWDVGLLGTPPIRELEERFGTKWRNPNDSKLLSRRMAIVQEIELIAANNHITKENAAIQLENRRIALGAISLQKFAEHLKSSRNNSSGRKKRKRSASEALDVQNNPRSEKHSSQAKIPKKDQHSSHANTPKTDSGSYPRTETHSSPASIPKTDQHSSHANNPKTDAASFASVGDATAFSVQQTSIKNPKTIEIDPFMQLDDKYSHQSWIEIDLKQSRRNVKVLFMDTYANGLCFYYSLRRFGIDDPRKKMIQFLNSAENFLQVDWWLSVSQKNKQDVIRMLEMDPDLDTTRETWADEFMIMLASLAFQIKIVVFHQYQESITVSHGMICREIPRFQFTKTAYLYHHVCGEIVKNGKKKNLKSQTEKQFDENHYGLLTFLDSKTNRPVDDVFIEQWVDDVNEAWNKSRGPSTFIEDQDF
jgi:hypothetical protein